MGKGEWWLPFTIYDVIGGHGCNCHKNNSKDQNAKEKSDHVLESMLKFWSKSISKPFVWLRIKVGTLYGKFVKLYVTKDQREIKMKISSGFWTKVAEHSLNH